MYTSIELSQTGPIATLTLARPEGAPAGTRGLGLFLVPRTRDDGTRNAYTIHRLKDKLGTRSLATGEVTLHGRPCLLLTYAGNTLAREIADHGPASLDYASRWGEDLLDALGVLEQFLDVCATNLEMTRLVATVVRFASF